ncbi:histone deacetylase complex subunit [Rhynchospora pubera]|uniref:Histone deacetylase complex subunit n=1 Tax=Rhynchospora pubera TaxID=906938 RepID=A0AAV8HW74_9POAL|nr:histone deacetylase complex subunit [Rhynchospora pubera]KAJ4819611.1 histone deacetylase complex subunit [Rhynchospora pubera]
MLGALEREMSGACVPMGNGMGYSHSSSGSEEEASALPVHTKVVVTGNNRTKSVLIGLQGVVKKAVGLGGWHWLILTNGIEVKLQRNALTVIEAPNGNETDDVFICDNNPWNLTTDIDDSLSPKRQKPRSKPNRSSSVHKSLSWSHSCESRSKDSDSSSLDASRVDLSKLETDALRRYCQHFNIDSSPNPSKEQLIEGVQRHFGSQQLDEMQVLVGFMKAAKRLKNACG